MKHIEVSRKIKLDKKIGPAELRTALLARLEKIIKIDSLTDGVAQFNLTGTTGSPTSMTRHAQLDLDIHINFDSENDVARIIISGYSQAAKSLVFMFLFLFIVMLLVGLLPGFFETNAERSGALDALLFLIFGIYTLIDINKRLAEPKEHLESALESLDTQFG